MPDSLVYVNAPSAAVAFNAVELPDKDVGGIIRRITYLNYTQHVVHVLERDSLCFTINPVPNRFSTHFVIRTEYTIPRNLFRTMHDVLSATIDPVAQSRLAAVRDAFFKQYVPGNPNIQILRLLVDTTVDQTALTAYQGLYLNTHDTVLTIHSAVAAIPHPFSAAAVLNARYQVLTQRAGISLAIELIDNDRKLQSRYLTLANQLAHLTPVEDVTRAPGIYFTLTDHTVAPPTVQHRHYTFEEGEAALGLYRTQEETLLAGDTKTARQEEVARLTHENALVRLDLQKIEQEHEAELAQLRIDAARTESRIKEYERETKLQEQRYAAERNQMERELQRMKATYEERKAVRDDHYQERSAARKDSSELIKFIPVIVAAGLAVWVAILKSKAA